MINIRCSLWAQKNPLEFSTSHNPPAKVSGPMTVRVEAKRRYDKMRQGRKRSGRKREALISRHRTPQVHASTIASEPYLSKCCKTHDPKTIPNVVGLATYTQSYKDMNEFTQHTYHIYYANREVYTSMQRDRYTHTIDVRTWTRADTVPDCILTVTQRCRHRCKKNMFCRHKELVH